MQVLYTIHLRNNSVKENRLQPELPESQARDSEWQWHQLGPMQVCTLLQTDNHTSTPPLSFLQAGCPSCRPTNSVKALKPELPESQIDTIAKLAHTEKKVHSVYSHTQDISASEYDRVY